MGSSPKITPIVKTEVLIIIEIAIPSVAQIEPFSILGSTAVATRAIAAAGTRIFEIFPERNAIYVPTRT